MSEKQHNEQKSNGEAPLLSELERIKHRYQAILDQSPTAFLSMDTQGRVIDWNSRAEQMFGWKRDEVKGMLLSDAIIPEAHRNAHNQGLGRYMASKNPKMMDRPIRSKGVRKDGSELQMEFTIFPVQTGDDIIFGAYVVELG